MMGQEHRQKTCADGKTECQSYVTISVHCLHSCFIVRIVPSSP